MKTIIAIIVLAVALVSCSNENEFERIPKRVVEIHGIKYVEVWVAGGTEYVKVKPCF